MMPFVPDDGVTTPLGLKFMFHEHADRAAEQIRKHFGPDLDVRGFYSLARHCLDLHLDQFPADRENLSPDTWIKILKRMEDPNDPFPHKGHLRADPDP